MGRPAGMAEGDSVASKPLSVTAVGCCTMSVTGTGTRLVPLPGPGIGSLLVTHRLAL